MATVNCLLQVPVGKTDGPAVVLEQLGQTNKAPAEPCRLPIFARIQVIDDFTFCFLSVLA